jgi:uncharacterized coiled-coil protein SlyX
MEPLPRQTIAEKVQALESQGVWRIWNDVRAHDRMSWLNPLKWFNHHRISKYRKLCVYHHSSENLCSNIKKEPVIDAFERRPLVEVFSRNHYGKRWLPRFLANDFSREHFWIATMLDRSEQRMAEMRAKIEQLKKENTELRQTLAESERMMQGSQAKHVVLMDKLEAAERRNARQIAEMRQEAVGMLKQRSRNIHRAERNLRFGVKSSSRTDPHLTEADILSERALLYSTARQLGVGHLFFSLCPAARAAQLGAESGEFGH